MTDLVHFHVEHPGGARDRWGTVFRPILVSPHAILVGGPWIGFGSRFYRGGALGMVALACAVFDWFAIVFTGHSIEGLRNLKRLYLCWRARVMAYAFFLRDEYPPFGDGPYRAWLELPDEPERHGFAVVALRLFLLFPHLIVLLCLMVVQLFIAIASWFSIAFTRRLSDGLWRSTRDVMSYALRVEAYALLMHDQFPSFGLTGEVEEPALVSQS